jgi:hypothetical protein
VRIRILLIAIAFVAASAGANALSVSPQSGWSNLTTERLQQLPSSVRAAIVTAHKACGGDSIDVRNGFIRYLKDANGDEFVALHFDQLRCNNRSAICTSRGCLHQIFVSRNGVAHREVWRDHVQEIDMTNETGRMSARVECSRAGRYCATALRWNGQQLLH